MTITLPIFFNDLSHGLDVENLVNSEVGKWILLGNKNHACRITKKITILQLNELLKTTTLSYNLEGKVNNLC